MAMASEDQVAQLERCMGELEAMVREVESVSSVLEFNAGSLGSAIKGTFTTTNKGAAKLAQEVSEDLKRWRAEREDEFVQISRHHAHRLKQAVHTRKKIEADRIQVRQVVRSKLFDTAEEAMMAKINELEDRPPEPALEPDGGPALMSRGPFALGALRKRLELIVSPVEASRPGPPQEIETANAISASALERKRMRIQVQQSSLPGMASALDADLLDVAERSFSSRKDAIVEQFDRQASAIKQIKQAMNHRSEAFEELAALQRSGPPPTPQEHWRALWPREAELTGFERGRAATNASLAQQLGDGTLLLPRSTQMEGQDMQELQDELLRKGRARNEELCAEFQRRHLRLQKPSQEALDVQGELEMWKLGARQALLDDLRHSLKDSHEGVVGSLKSSLLVNTDSPEHQMADAIAAGEQFTRHRNDALNDVIGTAEAKLQQICRQDRETFGAWRRRAELCALKRWTDIPNAIDDARYAAMALALGQLGEIAQKLVSDCHGALPLPREDFKASSKQMHTPTVSNMFAAWDRYNAPVTERLAFAERVVLGLNDTVETCAVAKAALCLIDEEMVRITKKLKENPSPMSGVGKPAREERMRAMANAK